MEPALSVAGTARRNAVGIVAAAPSTFAVPALLGAIDSVRLRCYE